MKKFFNISLAIFLIITVYAFEVQSSEIDASKNRSEIIIADKYAERYCSAKADHFFEGLDNEKTLKYSYFKYIGLKNKEILSKEMNKLIIQQIKDICTVTNEEEIELKEFLSKNIYQEKNK